MKERAISNKVMEMTKDRFIEALYEVSTISGIRVLFNTYCHDITKNGNKEFSNNIEDLCVFENRVLAGTLADGTVVTFKTGSESDGFGREYYLSVFVGDNLIISADDTHPNFDCDWEYPQLHDENGHSIYGKHPAFADEMPA